MKKKKTFWSWVKDHKEVIGAGALFVFVSSALGLALYENKKNDCDSVVDIEYNPIPELSDNTSRTYTYSAEAFDVSQHLRNLPKGQHHSAEKAEEAWSLGIELRDNQTLVDAYTKNSA